MLIIHQLILRYLQISKITIASRIVMKIVCFGCKNFLRDH